MVQQIARYQTEIIYVTIKILDIISVNFEFNFHGQIET